jgi:hypothetical protein
MADISQTAANVASGSGSLKTELVQYGESVTQGMPLYQSSTDSKYYQCDANDGIAKAACKRIALTPGTTDTYGVVAVPSTTSGKALINLGATLAVGTMYAVSATKGGIAPIADISSTQFVTAIGFAVSASLLDFQVTICTVAKA